MIDGFLSVEKKYHLLDDKIFNFEYWIYIRDKVCDFIEDIAPKLSSADSHGGKMDALIGTNAFSLSNASFSLKNLALILLNSTIYNPLLVAKKKKILFFPSPRRILVNGKYFAYWTDELQGLFDRSSVSAEFINITSHSRPYWNSNVIEMDYVDVYALLQSRIHFILRKRIKRIASYKASQISELLFKELEVRVPFQWIENLIVTRYMAWLYKKKYLTKFIKKVSPKIIVEVCHYSNNCLIVNEIAKTLGVCTVELQHGIIGKDHIGYNYLINSKKKQLPDRLFVYSDYWKKTCRFPIGNDNIISVGYPFADMQYRMYPPQKSDEDLMRILFLSQPVFHDEFVNAINLCAKFLNDINIKFKIIIKPHPSEVNQSEGWWGKLYKQKNIVIMRKNSVSLYELFANSDIQIGATSTAIYEGLRYDLYTIICNFGNALQQMGDLIDKGYAEFCSDIRELGSLIYTWKKRNNTPINHEVFFKNNSINNMKNEIVGLLK